MCYTLNIQYKRTRRNMLTTQMKQISENKITYSYTIDFNDNRNINE